MTFASINLLLQYRTTYYIKSDIKFTLYIKKEYNKLPSEIKNAFNNYSMNLMQDHYISKIELMKAVLDFEMYNNINNYNNIIDNCEWKEFAIKVYKNKCCFLF
jgi:hypothetical protein